VHQWLSACVAHLHAIKFSPTKSPFYEAGTFREDAPPSALFGPTVDAKPDASPTKTTQRAMAHLEVEKHRMAQITGGVNGILIGAGETEIPWSTKKHVEQQLSKNHGHIGALGICSPSLA